MKRLILKKSNVKRFKEKFGIEILGKEWWKEIKYKEVPVILNKIKENNESIEYQISIPWMPNFYVPIKNLEIKKELEEEFLKIFKTTSDHYIRNLEILLFQKTQNNIEKEIKKAKNKEKND